MAAERTHGLHDTVVQGQNLKAIGFMLATVLLDSFIPPIIVGSGGNESPFLFNAIWNLGVVAGCLLFLTITYRPTLYRPAVVFLAFRRAIRLPMLLAVGNGLTFTLFAVSTQFIDASVAAVLRGTWPIVFILVMATRFHERQRYRRNIPSVLPLITFALVGFGFTIASQGGGLVFGEDFSSALIVGTCLAVLAAVASGTGNSYIFNWAVELVRGLPADAVEKHNHTSLVLFGTILGFGIGNLGAAIVNLLLGISPLNSLFGLSIDETLDISRTISLGGLLDLKVPLLVFAVLGGLLFNTGGSILIRVSNLTTNNLGVNALSYGTPIVALIWLAAFLEVGVASVPFLIIGTASIISANLLINFEAERLLGFKALVMSFWVCGTFVYLRNTEGWEWLAKSDSYFDVLFLSATVFALILSFRVVRLANRTQEEDNRALKLFRELEELELQGTIEKNVSRNVAKMDESEGRELEAAYIETREAISKALLAESTFDREKLREIEIDLDILAHSRQQGINFGEICALFIFAGLVVGTSLLSRPADVQGLTGFLVEMFAMLFPAVIIFLTFNVLDLQRDRIARILEAAPQYQGYGVAFQDTVREGERIEHSGRRTAEQWISVAVGLALIVAYSGLFLHKWGLWPQVQNAILNPLS